jgi:hypothetical protein
MDFQRTTWHYILEDRILHNQRRVNLISYKLLSAFLDSLYPFITTIIVKIFCLDFPSQRAADPSIMGQLMRLHLKCCNLVFLNTHFEFIQRLLKHVRYFKLS